MKYADLTKETPFRKNDRVFKENDKREWIEFIRDEMEPLLNTHPEESGMADNNTNFLTSNVVLRDETGAPFENLIKGLNDWTLQNECGGDLNSLLTNPSENPHNTDNSQELSEESLNSIMEMNATVARELTFNNGVTATAIKKLQIDHDRYQFTEGEIVSIYYQEEDGLTEEENRNVKLFPFLARYMGSVPGDNSKVKVWDYVDTTITSGKQKNNKEYLPAYHTEPGRTAEPYLVEIKKNTIISGNIRLNKDFTVRTSDLNKYRTVILQIEAEKKTLNELLQGDLYLGSSQTVDL